MKNETVISGKIISEFCYSHEILGEKFYTTYVSVCRTSGTEDKIPVMVSEKLINPANKYIDTYVCIEGQYRSHIYRLGTQTHFSFYVFAMNIDFENDECDKNQIDLNGIICKPPTYRTTPLGRTISDVLVSIPRNCRKADYIPCICWGRNAHFASKLNIGDLVQINGRIQSRAYEKIVDGIPEKRITYEISAININPIYHQSTALS